MSFSGRYERLVGPLAPVQLSTIPPNAVPPALLDVLEVRSGSTVALDIDGGRLIVVPRRPPNYSLDDLILQCDPTAPLDDEDRTWIGGAALGEELL